MKNRYKMYVGIMIAIWMLHTRLVFADSSWYWISKERPSDLLPIVALTTILIETGMIHYIPKATSIKQTLLIVTAANLISFLGPYILLYIDSSWYGSLNDILNSMEIYTVNAGFLILTLVLEVPMVYYFLKEKVKKKPRILLATIVCVNVITTIMVWAIEHQVCHGTWGA